MLGFGRNALGIYSRKWDNLEIHAPQWLDGYHFMGTWRSADGRQIGAPEFRVGSQVAPAILLAQLYKACAAAFAGHLPSELEIGKAGVSLSAANCFTRAAATPNLGRPKILAVLFVLSGRAG